MKQILFLLLFLPVLAFAQFPANPNKIRLGNQTTADGLVVRTAASPSWTPSTINNAWLAFDTVAVKLYYYDGGAWNEYTGGTDTNFATDNLTFSGNRVHNLSTRTLTIADGGTYPTFQQSAATDGFTLASSATDLIAQTPGLLQIENSDTITITADRIRMNAADTRIQQVSKDNALNRLMALDSLTGQLKYVDKSSISSGGTVTGTGTTGTIPVWSSSTALGDSPLTVSGTDVAATGTGMFRLPNGTTAQQPGSPAAGMTRYNTSNSAFEYYGASAWEVPVKGAMITGLGTAARLPRFDAAGRIATDVISRIDPAIGLISIGSTASVTTGTNNNFFGTNNGIANVGGVDNNFFGNSAGRANTSGSYNNFFGLFAGRQNTTGSGNNFVGLYAGQNNTTGGSNNFFGEEAGSGNTSGSFNDMYGVYSGLANTTGSFNTFIGNNSGRANTTGTFNIAIGRGAMQTSPAAVTGSYNTTLGAEANKTITGTATGNLVLGDQVNLPTANGNNQVVIKNIIFGTGASGTGTTIAAGSKVGIKVAAPARDLEVAGEVRITDLTTDTPTQIVGADADGDLGAITVGSGLSLTSGTLSATGAGGTVTSVGITAPAAGITVSGSPVTSSGSMTLALADDLAAVEGLSASGIATRTASNTWAARTIVAGAGMAVTNGDGVSGNPSLSLQFSEGYISVSGGGTTVTASTPERIDADSPGTATSSILGAEFSASETTVDWVGADDSMLKISGTVSFSISDNQDMRVSIYKEGVEIAVTEVRVTMVAGDYQTIHLPEVHITADSNDTFAVYVEPVAGTVTTTIHKCHLSFKKLY